jgi:hypothetical protein
MTTLALRTAFVAFRKGTELKQTNGLVKVFDVLHTETNETFELYGPKNAVVPVVQKCRHYKGGLYNKHFEVKLYPEPVETLVIYESAETSRKFGRPKTMFEDSLHYEGKSVPRFEKLKS